MQAPVVVLGTTSAHAENTNEQIVFPDCDRNYLRARGEYDRVDSGIPQAAELPPRTRRIPDAAAKAAAHPGTTSAHAENTGNPPPCHT